MSRRRRVAGRCGVEKEKRAASTPEGQFALKLMDGFSDEQTMLAAPDQFGQIHEASWARTMAEAIREELRGRCGDDEEAAEAIVSVTYD